jgi:hypothetical protein
MFSIPLKLENSSPEVVLKKYISNLKIFHYSSTGYKMYPASDPDVLIKEIKPCLGYWIRIESPKSFKLEGEIIKDEINLPLKAGWHQIGNPFFNCPKRLSELKIIYLNQILSFREAVQKRILRPYVWWWEKGKRHYQKGDENTILKPCKGYWIKVLKDCEIIFSP